MFKITIDDKTEMAIYGYYFENKNYAKLFLESFLDEYDAYDDNYEKLESGDFESFLIKKPFEYSQHIKPTDIIIKGEEVASFDETDFKHLCKVDKNIEGLAYQSRVPVDLNEEATRTINNIIRDIEYDYDFVLDDLLSVERDDDESSIVGLITYGGPTICLKLYDTDNLVISFHANGMSSEKEEYIDNLYEADDIKRYLRENVETYA